LLSGVKPGSGQPIERNFITSGTQPHAMLWSEYLGYSNGGTVGKKTVPMFGYFGKIDLLKNK
jgi:hypothetical protein